MFLINLSVITLIHISRTTPLFLAYLLNGDFILLGLQLYRYAIGTSATYAPCAMFPIEVSTTFYKSLGHTFNYLNIFQGCLQAGLAGAFRVP